MIIEDGTGKGYQAAINNDNKLLTASVSSTIEHYSNHAQGKAFNLVFSSVPVSGSDCFLYIKNGDKDNDIVMEGFWFKMEADDYIDFVMDITGTPSNGTSITPVNLNTNSGSSAIGTFENGNDITGLSGGNTVMRIFHANSKESIYRNFDQDIVIGYNGTLALYIGSGTVQVDGILSFNYHSSVIE
jgi:hypothetical protein